jgi:glycosyltransferase involved in cell wall biosynthesis
VETSLCPKFKPSLVDRASRRLLGLGDAQGAAEARIAEALRHSNGRDAFELFSTPYSRYAPEDHPWVREAGVAHLHWTAGFVDYSRFFQRVGRPVVWTLHDQSPYLGGFHYEGDRETAPGLAGLEAEFRQVKEEALARSGVPMTVVGNSAWNTRRAEASGMFPRGTRFDTVYYPLDGGRFSPVAKSEAKAALGMPAGEFTVGFASTSLGNRRKGLSDLIAALGSAGPNGAPARTGLLSFGRPADEALRGSVRVPWHEFGFVDDDAQKRTLFSAMDCFVIPSRAEAFGQTAIEAMACGTPVVGSAVGGIVEALDEGRTGLLFPPGDAPEIARLVRRLSERPDEAANYAEAGRRHVLARHDPAASAAAYARIYNEIAADRPVPTA